MTKLALATFALSLVAGALTVVGLLPPLVPQSLFALGLGMMLLNIVGQSDTKP